MMLAMRGELLDREAFIGGTDSIIHSQRSPERTRNVFSVRQSRTGKYDGSIQIAEVNDTKLNKLNKKEQTKTKQQKKNKHTSKEKTHLR